MYLRKSAIYRVVITSELEGTDIRVLSLPLDKQHCVNDVRRDNCAIPLIRALINSPPMPMYVNVLYLYFLPGSRDSSEEKLRHIWKFADFASRLAHNHRMPKIRLPIIELFVINSGN
jgi:hypothetical protein